ncbi:MCE family protein [Mycolicibacterium sp.]|uniref:MCE family protein n=1 Tax=Mycolicibacterium sp. TaxID=2320850 RepID=UPI003D11D4A8
MSNRGVLRIGAAVALAVALVLGVVTVTRAVDPTRIHITGYFANSNGLFVGDEVRILGVPVGEIESIEPQVQRVKITFWVNDRYKVPADVNAAILSPSLVTSRAIQLTPVYDGGPQLADGAVIPPDRTAVPVEWDDFRVQLQRLSETLQPDRPGGVSSLGALINTTADNLRGEGVNIREMMIELSSAFSALGDHSDDLYGTFKSLSALVSALEGSTDLMREVNVNLAAATRLLSDDPDEVGAAVESANAAIGEVETFVAANREALGTTSDKLGSVTTALMQSIDDIKQTLHLAPSTFQNFLNIYQPSQAALTGALALTNFANPIAFMCGAIQAASRLGAEQSAKLCVQYLAPIFKNRQYNFLPVGMNPLVGQMARPNEITYSEDWMRPDYIPPAPPAAPAALAAPATPAPAAPLAAEAQPTDPAAGLPGMMLPPGGQP